MLVERVVTEDTAASTVELVEVRGTTRGESMRRFTSNPTVEYAEPNWIYTHDATSNDPYFTGGSLWGVYGDGTVPTNPYGSQAGEAWAAGNTGSAAVYVGIIDEGYQYTHPDLAPNVATNPGEIPGDGVDNDRNDYVDDVYGWDFHSNDNTVYDGAGDDHGTHVAGTIGAEGGNGIGVAGVAWDVRLLNAKFLGPDGGTTANAVQAVDYFTDLKKAGMNIVATNNSWGGGGYSQALYDAIERANAENILFIAAAGNGGADKIGDNNDSAPHYPSNYTNPNVIAVASITSSGSRSSFSNYGVTSVDLGAPGSGIYSTLPGGAYGAASGTSMATPHVTGGAALYAAAHPNATAAQIKSALLASTVATSSMQNRTVTGGRLNVSGFVAGGGTGDEPVDPGDGGTPLNASFTKACSGATCNFTAAETGYTSYTWVGANPVASGAATATYTSPGTHTVQLTVAHNGSTATSSTTVSCKSGKGRNKTLSCT